MKNPMFAKVLDSIMGASTSALRNRRKAGMAKPSDAITGEETSKSPSRPMPDGSRPDDEAVKRLSDEEAHEEAESAADEENSGEYELSADEMEMLQKYRAARK